MATSSFGTTLEIKDDKAADAMIRAMENPSILKRLGNSDIPEALERGLKSLKERSTR